MLENELEKWISSEKLWARRLITASINNMEGIDTDTVDRYNVLIEMEHMIITGQLYGMICEAVLYINAHKDDIMTARYTLYCEFIRFIVMA